VAVFGISGVENPGYATRNTVKQSFVRWIKGKR
jgi:hypothetical protein